MKGETRRVKGRNGTDTIAKREIAGNTYIVVVAPIDDTRYSHTIIVWADKVDGADNGMPSKSRAYKVKDKGYDELAATKVRKDKELAPVISKTVNKAVGKLTNTLEDTKSQEDAVLGALEANAEVHEGDE